MISLILGTAFFVGIHLFISGTTLRDRLTDAMGEMPYLGLFSLASTVGIFWMCSAYANAPVIPTWGDSPVIGALTTWILMPIAFFLAVVGITTPNPTAMGGEKTLDGERAEVATGIIRITRHPFLCGIALWAASHLLANGDAASAVFFSGMLVLGLAGPPSIDRKRARKLGGKWDDFERQTSILPFAAIAAGHNRLVVGELLGWRLVAAAGAFALMYYTHPMLFGG